MQIETEVRHMLRMTHGHGFFHDFSFFHHEAAAEEMNWTWLMLTGILFVVLGAIGLGMLFLVTIASILFIGVLALVGGVAQVIHAFTAHGWRNILSGLLMGALYIFVGAVIIGNPVASSKALTLVLAWALVILGVIESVSAIEHRSNRLWGWSLFSGLLSIALGILLRAQWPVAGLWAIGLFVSIEMIVHGWGHIALALTKKEASV